MRNGAERRARRDEEPQQSITSTVERARKVGAIQGARGNGKARYMQKAETHVTISTLLAPAVSLGAKSSHLSLMLLSRLHEEPRNWYIVKLIPSVSSVRPK